MQSSRLSGAIAALALIAPATAYAHTPRQPSGKTLVSLTCEGERCVGRSETAARDLLAHCRLVVREMGPVSRFRVGGRELSERELRACNRFVIRTQPPRD